MKIWVDADACPAVIKETLFRAAVRTETLTTLVANHSLTIPPSPWIKFQQVASGFDVADNKIVAQLNSGDLVISSDIPLAAEAIEKGAIVLSPRGELYTESNIRARLNMRDFMENLRSSGIDTDGPSTLNQADRQAFANQLDKYLTQNKRKPHSAQPIQSQ
ncbi:MAG: YaiI/YqxD family protein [Thiomicrorhabdus sp.]|nr:YaiI/YqxD family protein [Thiomicrorhabdus sp.]